MKRNSEHIKMIFDGTIFDQSIGNFLKEESEQYDLDECFDNAYRLTVYFDSDDMREEDVNTFLCPYQRPWYDTNDFLKRAELVLRVVITNIKKQLESVYFELVDISVEAKPGIRNTEIELEKVGAAIFPRKKVKSEKIYLNIQFENHKSIIKIVDSIDFEEWDFYIDERNNDKWFYNELLLRKRQKEALMIDDLSGQDWKQLILKEKVTTKDLSELFGVSEKVVTSTRKKFISNVKQYDDEYLFYYLMYCDMNLSDYYSNFTIPLLEQMKSNKMEVIYEYLNLDYHELFSIKEELRRQKEIERNNLLGKKYEMPLSGILLKKMYWAVKNHQLDRKFLKNSWFNTYYGKTFLNGFLERIEKSHILELYESGKIYEHPSFEPYQDLYQRLNIKESEELVGNESALEKVEMEESKAHIKKKGKRKICPPRDHVKLSKIKSEVGKTGEELVYQYEMDELKEYPELQEKIQKMYLIDESAGYDIESYDYDGNPIYIEVKTNKSDGQNRIHFYISKNEDQFITNHENAYIYYVYDLENPKLKVINQETYLSYYKNVVGYEVDQEVIVKE